MRIILVCNSPYKTLHNYSPLVDDYLIGIDGGAYDLLANGYDCDLAIGDFDTTDKLEYIKKHAKKTIIHSPIKDEIDLELAFKYIIKEKLEGDIYIYNGSMGRLDHELITVKLLHRYQNLNITLVSEKETLKCFNKSFNIAAGKRFSLIPLTHCLIDITGAKYNIVKSYLNINDCYTTSNYSESLTTVNIYEGSILVVEELI